ncbi:MAG: alpha/beta fold hydrolase [Planctomycetota bacterium]
MLRFCWLSFGALLMTVALATGPASADAKPKPTPPGQPTQGPGGSDYPIERVKATSYGEPGDGYWILEPRQRDEQARPVVLFVHGFGATHYNIYEAWITHLVRRGNVVVYPRYHAGGIVDPKTFTETAARAAAEALARCDGKKHALVDTDTLTMVGHSLGGTIIANLAARPEHYNLPTPKALMLLTPGDTRSDKGLGALFPKITEDHSTIKHGTLMLIVDAEGDYFVSPKAGQRILDNAKVIGKQDKRRLLMQTDAHGEPSIVSDHMLPLGWTTNQASQGRVNTYDYALWRWFDAMQSAVLGDEAKRELVFGEAAMDLGTWSDGTPVRRPVDASAK